VCHDGVHDQRITVSKAISRFDGWLTAGQLSAIAMFHQLPASQKIDGWISGPPRLNTYSSSSCNGTRDRTAKMLALAPGLSWL
jgi:hypothetical protein